MPTYEYLCSECGTVTDDLRRMMDRCNSMVCPACGGKAEFIISTPTIDLEGISGEFPTAYDRWERVRRQRLATERKLSDN